MAFCTAWYSLSGSHHDRRHCCYPTDQNHWTTLDVHTHDDFAVVLEFGTTVIGDADGSIAGLLGGSPGASTAVAIMLDVLQKCFANRYQSWLPTLKEMVPSLGVQLSNEPALFDEVWSWSTKALKLGAA